MLPLTTLRFRGGLEGAKLMRREEWPASSSHDSNFRDSFELTREVGRGKEVGGVGSGGGTLQIDKSRRIDKKV